MRDDDRMLPPSATLREPDLSPTRLDDSFGDRSEVPDTAPRVLVQLPVALAPRYQIERELPTRRN